MNPLYAFCPKCKRDTNFQRSGIQMTCQTCGYSYELQLDSIDNETPKQKSGFRKVLSAIVFVLMLLGGVAVLVGAVFFIGCLIQFGQIR